MKKKFFYGLVIILVIVVIISSYVYYSENNVFLIGNVILDDNRDLIVNKNKMDDKNGKGNEEILRPIRDIEKGNGIITNIWVYRESQLDRIREHEIRYLFIDVGDTGENGLIETPFHEIRRFIDFIESYELKTGYEFVKLPYSEVNSYNYDVNKEFEDNFISDYSRLIELGFDGVYVDIEPVQKGQEEKYLLFLEKLNEKFFDKIIGVYSGAVGKDDTKNDWEWSLTLYEKVSNRVDLIFVPGYDLYERNTKNYKERMGGQISDLKNLDKENRLNSYIMIGVPTHKKSPEVIENGLDVFSEEIGEEENSKIIGVGLFAEWTMDEEEWSVFEEFNL